MPTAISGLADWADVGEAERRVGTVDALANIAALALQVGSWRARSRGNRSKAVALSTSAIAVSSAAAVLAVIELRRGVGVDQTAFDDPPTAWTW